MQVEINGGQNLVVEWLHDKAMTRHSGELR
jgi:hypothetical protein